LLGGDDDAGEREARDGRHDDADQPHGHFLWKLASIRESDRAVADLPA